MTVRLLIPLSVLLLMSCDIDSRVTVDPVPSAPVLTSVSLAPSLINTAGFPASASVDTAVTLFVTIGIPAPRGTAVRYELIDDRGTAVAAGPLRNDGVSPDAAANDSTYTARARFTVPAGTVGRYSLAVTCNGGEGSPGATALAPLRIVNTANDRPVVSALSLQDTVAVPSGSVPNLVRVSLTAADAQGAGDITSVLLRSVRPDGSVAGVFPLYDDGSAVTTPTFGTVSGDSIAADGRYTLTIPIFSTTPKNTYRDFLFFAVDRSGAVSDTLRKRIHIQ